jgi:hypothetical protein
LARHFVTIRSNDEGASGWSVASDSGFRSMIAAITLARLVPSNGLRPVASS